jgi:hypothetical protein
MYPFGDIENEPRTYLLATNSLTLWLCSIGNIFIHDFICVGSMTICSVCRSIWRTNLFGNLAQGRIYQS